MSTDTLEREILVAPPEKVKIKSGKKSKKPKKGKKEIILVEDVTFLKKAQKRAKKAYKKSKGLMKKALRWVKNQSKKSYVRAMAWAAAGAAVGSTVANSAWARVAATTARVRATPLVMWASYNVRAAVGSVLGLSIWSIFGLPTLMTLGAALIAYLAVSNTRVTSRIVKVREGRKVKKADKQVVEDLMNGEDLELNEEQQNALSSMLIHLDRELKSQDQNPKVTVKEISNLLGQTGLTRERLTGNTGTVKEIFEKLKRDLTAEGIDFDGLALSTGIRTANSKVDKLLVEHQTETVMVEA